MSSQRVEVTQVFPFPVEKLFNFLCEHKNYEVLFPIKVKRIQDGKGAVNGVGSVRRMEVSLGAPFEETVTRMEPNRLIEYKITRGSPLRNHLGVLRFQPFDQGSCLHYTISFDPRYPGTGTIIKLMLETALRKGLKSLAQRSL